MCIRDSIEGECNRLGRAAGMNISINPGRSTFNPLFIYGGPGLGKTHLAQAIGIAIKEKYPEKVVLYVSANVFQNQYTCLLYTSSNGKIVVVSFSGKVEFLIGEKRGEKVKRHSVADEFR